MTTTPSRPASGDVIRCQNCGSQSRSISRGCSQCGHGRPVNHDAQVLRDYAALCRLTTNTVHVDMPGSDLFEAMAQSVEHVAAQLDQHGCTMAELLASGTEDGQ